MSKQPTTVQVLTRAMGLVKKGWCKKVGARDKNRRECHTRSKNAMYWCSVGATEAASKGFAAAACRRILRKDVGSSITLWNDAPGRTKRQVLAAFRRAIALAKREAKGK